MHIDPSAPLPQLSAEEECSLAALAQAGDRDAEDRMFRANLGLVFRHAGLIAKRHRIEFGDAWSAASRAVLESIRRFDPARGLRFSTMTDDWAWHYARAEVNTGHLRIHIPSHAMQKLYGRPRREGKLTEKQEQFVQLARKAMKFVATGEPEDPFESPLTHEADRRETPADRVAREDTAAMASRRIRAAIATLTPIEQELVIGFYGLDGDPETIVSIAARHGVGRERGRQILDTARRRLKRVLQGVAEEMEVVRPC